MIKIDDLHQIDTLIFDNGGMWGLSYIGVLKYLIKNGLKLNNISNFIGTSIGSVFCVLIATGFSLNEIYYIFMYKFIFQKIFNTNPLVMTYNMCFKWGLYSSEDLEKWIDNIICKKTGKKNMTFSEFTKKFSHKPNQSHNLNKNLYIIGSNITDQNLIIFSNITTPNISLAKAVVISLSFPGLITPTLINNKYYFDGALIFSNTYDLIIKPEKYLLNNHYNKILIKKNKKKIFVKKIKQINKKTIINLQFNRRNYNKKIKTIIDFICVIVASMSNFNSKTISSPNTILLDLSDINPSKFDISLYRKKTIIRTGYDIAENYFN